MPKIDNLTLGELEKYIGDVRNQAEKEIKKLLTDHDSQGLFSDNSFPVFLGKALGDTHPTGNIEHDGMAVAERTISFAFAGVFQNSFSIAGLRTEVLERIIADALKNVAPF